MKKILSSLLLAALLISAASCSDDKTQGGTTIPSDALYDIVTLKSTSASSSVFTAQKSENTSPVSYFSSFSFSDKKEFPVGCRMLIVYGMQNNAAPYTTGPINLYGYGAMNNTEPEVLFGSSAKYGGWDTEAMKMQSIWLTGQYLNVSAQLFSNSVARPTSFILVADEATVDEAVVECHLIVKSNTPDGGNLSPIYASFDISQIINLSTCKTIRVNYMDVNGFTFKNIGKPSVSATPVD